MRDINAYHLFVFQVPEQYKNLLQYEKSAEVVVAARDKVRESFFLKKNQTVTWEFRLMVRKQSDTCTIEMQTTTNMDINVAVPHIKNSRFTGLIYSQSSESRH